MEIKELADVIHNVLVNPDSIEDYADHELCRPLLFKTGQILRNEQNSRLYEVLNTYPIIMETEPSLPYITWIHKLESIERDHDLLMIEQKHIYMIYTLVNTDTI